MASLLNANLPSDEEEDEEYNPAADKTAEAADRKEFKESDVGTKKRARPRRGGGTSVGEDDEEEEDDSAHLLVADNLADPRVQAKKAKIDQLWGLLNSRPGGEPDEEEKPSSAHQKDKPSLGPSSSISLAALCKTVDAKERKKTNTDLIWMRQLGIAPKVTTPKSSSSVAGAGSAASTAAANTCKQGAAPDTLEQQPGPSSSGKTEAGPNKSAISEATRAAAAAALAAAKQGVSLTAVRNAGKVTITETRRFAGKDIEVAVTVDKDSKAAAKAAERASKPPPASGLDAFLSEIEKKKKVSVLDKSKADWNTLKSSDAALEEELEAHKRSGGQYLDKVDFLKRAELREYEQERDKRLASDMRTRGRL